MNKSLGITLAKEGYDVWAGNVRGNRYGRKHARLNPDTDEAFWDFSFESGYYDWPAMIDRVLKETNEPKLTGIAHSQGTTTFLVLSSLRPEYNEKVELLIALGPVAFLDQTGPVLSAVATAIPLFITLLKTLGINEVFGDHNAENKLLELLCSLGVLAENICDALVVDLIPGYDPDGIEPGFMPVLFAQFPTGTTRKNLEHYDQVFLSRRFAQFDYGPTENLRLYETITPPEYDLNKVNVKTAIFYGENDMVSTVKDVHRLAKLLPNLVYNKAIDKKKWSHVDFVWNTEADMYLFGHIFKLLSKSGCHFDDVPKAKYNVTKLIAPRPCLTAKYIQSLAADIRSVTHQWVILCCTNNTLLDTDSYALPAGWSIIKQAFVNWVPSSGKRNTQFFKDKVILLCGDQDTFVKFWERVCTLVGATTRVVNEEDLNMAGGIALVTEWDCPHEVQNKANQDNIPLVSTAWVVQCLLEAKVIAPTSHDKFSFMYTEPE